ncbi:MULTISPECIES: hypothetical protein [Silvimonas]|uniref:hypothetical protein n=1 Tax=Silvimonas TaxID=300264 RepID=UPI0024B3290B|nr:MULTISPECIES: hypothetical protein [Silvimonas]MDR3425870.1 hypothetical protein [Silvimonas sp.]
MKRLIVSLVVLAFTGLTAGSVLADGVGAGGTQGGANGVMRHPMPKPAPDSTN